MSTSWEMGNETMPTVDTLREIKRSNWKFLLTFLECCVVTEFVYLRRQQERGLMQKARRLMDENSASLQMFLILLSSITLGSESQISVFKQCQSNTSKDVRFFFYVRVEHAQKPKFGDFSVKKKNFIRHFARFNFSRLSLAFILKYYPILHAVKR